MSRADRTDVMKYVHGFLCLATLCVVAACVMLVVAYYEVLDPVGSFFVATTLVVCAALTVLCCAGWAMRELLLASRAKFSVRRYLAAQRSQPGE